jgi:hypothetical protein
VTQLHVICCGGCGRDAHLVLEKGKIVDPSGWTVDFCSYIPGAGVQSVAFICFDCKKMKR